MDLIRDILIGLSESESTMSHKYRVFDDGDVAGEYHAMLACNAGLVKFNSNYYKITWEGHNLLDMIQDDRVWENMKSLCASAGIGITQHAIEFLHDYF